MAFRKDNFKRNEREDYMKKPFYEPEEPKESEGSPETYLSEKALKNLPKSTYSFLADPYAAGLPESNPYAILARFNKKVGGTYAGEENLDGGNIQQYPNSLRSGFLKATDFMKLPISVNYRFITTRLVWKVKEGDPQVTNTYHVPKNATAENESYAGKALIDQQRQAVSEATSVLQSTTFTQMPIYDYAVITDIAMGNAPRKAVTIGGVSYYAYYRLEDVIYAASKYYQITVQEIIGIINAYNSYRMKQGTMIRSSWNRETPKLNGMFGIHNKKTFINLIDSLCLAITGEYVDQQWSEQMNMLNMMPSRRANDINDPVLELQVRGVQPHYFRLITVDSTGTYVSTIFQDGIVKEGDTVTKNDMNVQNSPLKDPGEYTSFWEAIGILRTIFSAEDTMAWARSTDGSTETETERFNRSKWALDVVNMCFTVFKTKMNDIREVFDVIQRAGLNTWVKKFRPAVTKNTDAALFDNAIVNDIFKNVMSGANEIEFDNNTKRWRFFTGWNLYNGIPEYDDKSGGAFLSFSSKSLVAESDDDKTIEFLPIAFYYDGPDYGTPTVDCVTRDGKAYQLTSTDRVMSNVVQLKRLAPLPSQTSLELRVPQVPDITGDSDGQAKSHAMHTASQIFGVAQSGSLYNVDPDLICIYQIEIADITNRAIAYARSHNVFKGTSEIYDDLGFSKFGQA